MFVPSVMTGRQVHVVREGETDPRAQRFIADLIRKAVGGGYITHFAEQTRSPAMTLLDAAAAGEIVALQGDRPRTCGRTHDGSSSAGRSRCRWARRLSPAPPGCRSCRCSSAASGGGATAA